MNIFVRKRKSALVGDDQENKISKLIKSINL